MSGSGHYWDVAWNPIVGCSGCGSAGPRGERCWAAKMARRQEYRDLAPDGLWTGEVRFRQSVLGAPFHWRDPRVVAVNWMGDMFGEGVPDAWIERVYAVMELCPQHTFLVLTKRSKRRWEHFSASYCLRHIEVPQPCDFRWPLSSVWEGASAWDQPSLEEQWGELAQTPAAHRWLSLEPLLAPVDLSPILIAKQHRDGYQELISSFPPEAFPLPKHLRMRASPEGIVLGGETGAGARPVDPDWVRKARDDCATAGVPFFLKSLGQEKGRLLDGREHNEVPWKSRTEVQHAANAKRPG